MNKTFFGNTRVSGGSNRQTQPLGHGFFIGVVVKSLWYGIFNDDDDYIKHDRNRRRAPPPHCISNKDVETLISLADDTESEILLDRWLTRLAEYRIDLLKRKL